MILHMDIGAVMWFAVVALIPVVPHSSKIFEEIAFANDVRAMRPFQCRHKCKKNVTLKEIQSTLYSQNTVINVTCMASFSYIAINKSMPQTAIWLNQHQAIMPS